MGDTIDIEDASLGATEEHLTEPWDWESYIFTHGIQHTYNAVNTLNRNNAEEDDTKKPSKLLFSSCIRGQAEKKSGPGQFNSPRGVTTRDNGDIIVADTLNHRLQLFNKTMLFKDQFGKKGKRPGDFNRPTDVSVMRNGHIVVADSKNKRVQVLNEVFEFKYEFSTGFDPYYVTCDKNLNIIVSTMRRSVEIYRQDGTVRHKFLLRHQRNSLCAPIMAHPHRQEIILCDMADGCIKFFSYAGVERFCFQVESNTEGLSSRPCSIAQSPSGEILVADNLNHCVNAYSETGTFLSQVIKPPDSAGPVVACTVSPQGHLVITEHSMNGVHCVKVFRYMDCECHKIRPGIARRANRSPSPVKLLASSSRK